MKVVVRKNQFGLSIIETMIALLIMGIIGTAIVSMMTETLSTGTAAKLRNQATAYAEQGLEQVRNYYQTDKYAGLSSLISAGKLCHPDGVLSMTSNKPCPANLDNCTDVRDDPNFKISSTEPFNRLIYISGAGPITVRAIMVYNEKGLCRKMETSTLFYNY